MVGTLSSAERPSGTPLNDCFSCELPFDESAYAFALQKAEYKQTGGSPYVEMCSNTPFITRQDRIGPCCYTIQVSQAPLLKQGDGVGNCDSTALVSQRHIQKVYLRISRISFHQSPPLRPDWAQCAPVGLNEATVHTAE